jgi:hypothetical protein
MQVVSFLGRHLLLNSPEGRYVEQALQGCADITCVPKIPQASWGGHTLRVRSNHTIQNYDTLKMHPNSQILKTPVI